MNTLGIIFFILLLAGTLCAGVLFVPVRGNQAVFCVKKSIGSTPYLRNEYSVGGHIQRIFIADDLGKRIMGYRAIGQCS